MIKKAPQKSPTSPQSRRSRAPVRSAVSAIHVSPKAPAATDTCANQPPAASPLPPNNSKSSRRRAPAGQNLPATPILPSTPLKTFSRQARPKRACPAEQNLPTTPPELPSAPLKTFSRQTRLTRVCPCPTGQNLSTAAAPLSPSPLPLNRTTSNQPADKCGSSAFAPTGLFPRIRRKIKCLFSYPAPAVQTAPTLSAPTTSHTPTAPTHHGKPLYAGVADTARVADTALAAPTTSPAAPTTSPAAPTTAPTAPTSPTLSAFDLALWLKQRARKADPLFWLAFAVAFVALNLIFLFHGAHFLFGDHDWKYLKPGLSLGAGLFEGRFAQFLPINILSGGDILPIVNNILGFAGFSLGVALLARYWRLPRQKSAWLLFALFTAVTPYILSFMYFAFLIIPVLGWSAFVLGSLLISEKEMRFSPIRSLSAIALATLALGGYPPVVNLMAVALAVRLLFAALFEGESARGLWRRYRWTAINLLLAAICCKLCLWGLGKIGAMNTAYYNLQTTPLTEWGNKFLLVSRDLWQQFTVTLPFIDTPYKTAAGLVAACGVVSFTRLLIAPKSDAAPNQPTDHQARPSYSPSQPDSSHPTNQPPSAIPGACPAELPTTSALPSAPLKTFSQQTRLARVCPCPAGQPTSTATTPLSPSPLSLNPTSPDQPAAKCGSSAFAPTGQNLSANPLLPTPPLESSILQTTPAVACPVRATAPTKSNAAPNQPTDQATPAVACPVRATAPTKSNAAPNQPTDHPAHHALYAGSAATTPANRISQTALLLLLFAAILYAPLLTLFISTSLAETEFSPRIDFFGLMYFYAAMFALTLKAAAPAASATPYADVADTGATTAVPSPALPSTSPISQALKNLATTAAIAAIAVSANNLFDAQKVWKLGFDAEMKLYRRIAARFMASPDFFPGARYIMVQGGSLTFRPRFYHTPYKRGSDDLLDTPYVPGMNPAVMWNYYGVTEYGDPKSYVYTLRPTASDAEIIRRAVPWPSPKSAKVINADSSLQNWIMLIMTPNGHAAVKNTYGL